MVFLLCGVLSWYGSEVAAQSADSVAIPRASYRMTKVPDYVIYADFSGLAQRWLSLHAEMTLLRFRHELSNTGLHNSIRGSVGVTVFPADRIYVPVVLKYLTFEKSPHFEFGVGLSFLAAQFEPVTGKPTTFAASPFIAVGSIAYRFEPADGGIMGRIAYSPMYEFSEQDYRHGISFSLGMAF